MSSPSPMLQGGVAALRDIHTGQVIGSSAKHSESVEAPEEERLVVRSEGEWTYQAGFFECGD